MTGATRDVICGLPKAELHVHIEGTLEPELMFEMATRNGVSLPYSNVESVRSAYEFSDLQSFLDIYYEAADVLRTEQDFFDLMSAYLEKAAADGVRRAEIFFDPQTHTTRGIPFTVFMSGFRSAIAATRDASNLDASLIMCFLRHLGPDAAAETLKEAEPHLGGVIAVGLDSSELGYPPGAYREVYRQARALGLRCVAHAGEEGPADYIREALDVLEIERVDHGIHCAEDPTLMGRLRDDRIPLTVCPMSNVSLKQFDRMRDHVLPRLLAEGLKITINSDDPAFFGGYVGDNYLAVAETFHLGVRGIGDLARNSIEASFMPDTQKAELIQDLEMKLGDQNRRDS